MRARNDHSRGTDFSFPDEQLLVGHGPRASRACKRGQMRESHDPCDSRSGLGQERLMETTPRMPSACSGGGGLGIHSGRWHLGVAALVGAQHGVDDREPEDTGDEDHAEQDHGALAEGGLGGRSCLRRGLVAALGDGQLRRVDARRTACPHSRS